jgi:hypothetical protein
MWLKRLEWLTNIVLLVSATVVIAGAITRLRAPEAKTLPDRPGDRISETAELRFGTPTYILNTQSRCHFCTESMPLYKRLVEGGARVIAVSAEPIDVNRNYLESHGVHPAAVVSSVGNGLAFRGTPSLLLVDARGIVQGAWWGKQGANGESEILRGGGQK